VDDISGVEDRRDAVDFDDEATGVVIPVA